MEIELYKRRRELGMLGVALAIFKRLVAFFLLLSALRYWAMISGIYPGESVRFDLMPEHWQFASAALSIMLPVAALGLWGQFSWGTNSWLLTIAVELGMYLGRPDLFGEANGIVWFHLVALATYIFIKLIVALRGGGRRLLPTKRPG